MARATAANAGSSQESRAQDECASVMELPVYKATTTDNISVLLADKSAAYVRDNDDKKTALHIAASRGHLEAFKELISHCPDCYELVDKRHQNVLHYAIVNNRFEIQDFVQKDPWLTNVLLNGKDENQINTPFHQLAAFHKFRYVGRAGSEIIDSSKDLISDARVDKMTFI
ncbi:hypothetical protein ACLB2K_005568 [Fragaria x ananassa]